MLIRPTRARALGALLLLAVALGVGWWLLHDDGGGDEPPPPPDNVQAANTTYALLVGCTEYPELRKAMEPAHYESSIRLRGPENDTTLMQSVLHRYLGVPEENIRVLAGWPDDATARPTRANILGHLDELVGRVAKGGRVFFMFAGHGSQQPDREGGDETDNREEILLPADTGRWDATIPGTPNVITDNEIGEKLTALRDAGATVWAVFDCCHSGTMLRAPGPGDVPVEVDLERVRGRGLEDRDLGIPHRMSARPLAPTRGLDAAAGSRRLRGTESLHGIAAFSAAQSWQSAPEMTLPRNRRARGRRVHGLLTFLVARTLQRYGGAITLAELYKHVRAAYGSLPWSAATPAAEGDLTLRAVPSAKRTGAALLLRRVDGRLVVDAGALHDVTVGSILEVYEQGHFLDPAKVLGRLVLTEVGAIQSVCGRAPSGPALADFPDGAPARVAELVFAGPRLRLALLDSEARPATAARLQSLLATTFLDRQARLGFPFVDPDQAEWLLVEGPTPAGGPRQFILRPARPVGALEPIAVSANELVSVLERVHRSVTLRRLSHAGPRLPKGMLIEAEVLRMGSEIPIPWTPGIAVAPGDEILLRLTNGTGHDVDVWVKNLDALQVRSHVWPDGKTAHRLSKVETKPIELPSLEIGDEVLGRESLIVVVAVRASGAAPLHVEEAPVVVGATGSEPTDDQINDQATLDELASDVPTRGVGDAPIESVALHEITWLTTWGRLGVPSDLLAETTVLDPPVGQRVGPADGTPPPARKRAWQRARVVPGDFETADVLVLQGIDSDGSPVMGLFFDADGDAQLRTASAAEAAKHAGDGTLAVEMAVLLGTETVSAAYPQKAGDKLLGLELVAAAGADRATHRFELRAGSWTKRPTVGPWLSTAFLPKDVGTDETRTLLLKALRRFCRLP